jgi:uncharacterized membrane protein
MISDKVGTLTGAEEHKSVRVSLSASRLSQIIFTAAICSILIAAAWLRWSRLTSQSLWADEGLTTWFSQFSPAVQWHLLAWNDGSPLYYVAIHYWVSIWGNSVIAFRSLSALFSTLSLITFYFIARRIWEDRFFVALSLMIASFSFFQIWYAQESRSYALLDLLLLIAIHRMLLCLNEPTKYRLISLAVVLALALYTHNMAMFYVPGFVAFWFLYPSQMTLGVRIKKAAVVGALVLLLFAPWLPTLAKQMAFVMGHFWAPKPHAADLLSTLFTFCGLDPYVLQDLRHHLPISHFSGIRTLISLFLLAFGLCLAGAWWGSRPIDRRKSIALQLWTLLPIALVFLWSQIARSVYVDRNLIGACALMPMMLCAPIAVQSGLKRRVFQVITIALLIGVVISLSKQRRQRDDWRGVTAYLVTLPEQQRLVEVFQPYCQILVNYYATGQFKSYAKPEIAGLITDFHQPPSGPGFLPNLQTADPEAILSQAINEGKYKEIDVALQLERLPPKVQAIPLFFSAHCSSVQTVTFGYGNLGVTRCLGPHE